VCSWWQEWCHYAGVQALYDASSGRCVLGLRDACRRPFPAAAFAPEARSPPSARARPARRRDDVPLEPHVPVFRADIAKRPGCIKNHSLQVSRSPLRPCEESRQRTSCHATEHTS
jgi:hypothetical protein